MRMTLIPASRKENRVDYDIYGSVALLHDITNVRTEI